jgi:hypothetical protein
MKEGGCRPFVTCFGARFVSFHIIISTITLIFVFYFFFFDMARTSNRAFSPSLQGREVG